MKKNIIIGILIITLALILLYVELNTSDNNIKECTIHYRYEYNIYDIESNTKNIKVTKKNEIQCIKAPCNPITTDKYKVKIKSHYVEVINELCTNDEVTITEDMLNQNQKLTIEEIIKK